MDHLVLQALEEVALEGPSGCTVQQLWKLLEGNLPPEVRNLNVALKQQVLAQLRARADIEIRSGRTAPRSERPEDEAPQSADSTVQFDSSATEAESKQILVASSQARDMALGIYDQHVVHPLNDEMRRTLELTGKSRKKGAVQSELARICNVPHKNFFIVVKATHAVGHDLCAKPRTKLVLQTLETHSLVVRNNIQIRGDSGRVQTSILHLTRFAPDLAPGLKFAKTSAGDKSLYAVTDDEATVAILLKRMREMDPAGDGIVRSEFKRYVLRTMHTGNMRQNHRLWRRLQTKMVKQGVLELGVIEMHGKMRTVITAVQPEKVQQEQDDDEAVGQSFPLMAERSFAREFFHLVLNAGEEGIFMNELGKHLQFPTRTFHKPNYLQDFLQRLGLIYTKEQKGKAVVVCVRAPAQLLASYRQTNAPEGVWLQQGWLNAVHDAMDAGPPLYDPITDLAAPGAPLLVATPVDPHVAPSSDSPSKASGWPSPLPKEAMAPVTSPATGQATASASVSALSPAAVTEPLHTKAVLQTADTASRVRESGEVAEPNIDAASQTAVAQMPAIPEPSSAPADAENEEGGSLELSEAQKETVEAEVLSLPWVQSMSRLSQDRVKRMMLDLEKSGFLFRSAMRHFFRITDPPEVTGNGPDTKTVDRYLKLMDESGKVQKLSIPVSLTTSAVAAQDLIVYIKPDQAISDALVSKLVEKWRLMSSERRSQGVIGYHQALRHKAPKAVQEEAPKPRPVRPSKLNENIIKHGPDLVLKLYDNGYIRAKMIRIRLLHYWICKLLGLGGYERLAAAEGQSRPSEHVFTFKAAMPSIDHYQSTAQLTNGVESWGSPMALDAKQLWDWMPVEVFLQTVGTTKDITNRLELSAIGKRLRDLSPEEQSKLMDHRGASRTSQHMEMLRCLGLIESIVVAPPDGKAAFSVAPTVASRYVALTTGIIEVQRDKKRSTVSPSESTTDKDQFERCCFDLTTREGLESYWAQLAQMSVDYSKPNHGIAMRTWQRPAWFPATTVPDVLSRRAWNTLHVMTIEQSEKLKLAFETAADEHGYVSWVTCMQIAKQLGLEYEQVNALSNMRKAKLGRLEPPSQRIGSLKVKYTVGRTLSALPADLVAKHEALVRVNTAKRFAKQGVQAPHIPRLVEEHIQKNRRVRARADRKKRGLPPHRLRRKPSEIPEGDVRSFTDRKERRQRDKATRLDDGELGPGFMPKRPPRVRMRASTPAASSDADGAYVVRQFRGPKGPPHSFTNHEDNAILRAFARWRTHRSPEYFVNFRRFKLPVTLDMAKRRFYKALPRYQQTQKLLEELQELCIDVYQRHHARKLEKWQASQQHAQSDAQKQTGASAAAAAPQAEQVSKAEQQAQQQSSKPKRASASGQPAKPKTADEVVKAKRYITEDKLARLMHRSVATPNSVPSLGPAPDTRATFSSPTALSRPATSPLSPQSLPDLPPLPPGSLGGTPAAMPPPSTPATLTPLPPGQSPAKSPPGGRPLLDPFEPIFAVEDEEDEASLHTIKDIIGLILDVTPRRPVRPSQEPRKRRLFEAAEGSEARKRRHSQARADEDDDSAMLGGDAAASVLQGRSAARSWKKVLPLPARGPLQMPGAKKPNVIEAHAMELIKSLLFQGLAEHDVVAALSARFTVAEMTAALAYLQQQGLVNVSGVKRPLMLSRLFEEHMEVLDYPEQLPEEAAAARQQLQELLRPNDSISQEKTPVITLTDKGVYSGGLVCEVMSLVATGRLQLSLGTLQLDGTNVDPEDSHHDSQQAANPVSIHLLLTPRPGNISADQDHSLAPSNGCIHHWPQSMSFHQGPEASLAQASSITTESVTQSPSHTNYRNGKRKGPNANLGPEGVILSDSVGRRPKLAARASGNKQDLDVDSLDLVVRHMHEAVNVGLTKTQLADSLATVGADCSNLDAAVQALVDTGKLQWAPAFDQDLLVPVGILHRLKSGFTDSASNDTPPVQDFHSLAGLQAAQRRHQHKADGAHVAADTLQQSSNLPESALLGAAGHQQPNADSNTAAAGVIQEGGDTDSDSNARGNQQAKDSDPNTAFPDSLQQQQQSHGLPHQAGISLVSGTLLRPWTDHRGALNEPYWAALTQRVMSVVMRNPGIPESLLISQMQALNPQQAKTLLGHMTTQGQLQMQATYDSAAAAAVPAIFGFKANHEVQVVLHYFIAPGASFGSLSKLSPAA